MRRKCSRSLISPVLQGSAGRPSRELNDGLGDEVLSDESSSGWNSTSSPGEVMNDGEFVDDEIVREWTSASTIDADSYLASPMRRNVMEE